MLSVTFLLVFEKSAQWISLKLSHHFPPDVSSELIVPVFPSPMWQGLPHHSKSPNFFPAFWQQSLDKHLLTRALDTDGEIFEQWNVILSCLPLWPLTPLLIFQLPTMDFARTRENSNKEKWFVPVRKYYYKDYSSSPMNEEYQLYKIEISGICFQGLS